MVHAIVLYTRVNKWARAQQKESKYEESIAAYKETPAFSLVTKWNKKLQVRQKKNALQKANRSLRLHYYVRPFTSEIRIFIATRRIVHL